MAAVLTTETTLTIIIEDFTLLTEYSGEINPNITYDVLFTVTDGVLPLENVNIVIDTITYLTDANGQVTVSLIRGDYTAEVSLSGYITQNPNFTILDQNIVQNIVLVQIGSFDESYDDSFEK